MAQAVQKHLKKRGVAIRYIEPGAPWQNSYIESFNSRLCDELLDRELFTSRLEAQVLCDAYRTFHNEEHPHSALGYTPPAVYAASLPPTTPTTHSPILT